MVTYYPVGVHASRQGHAQKQRSVAHKILAAHGIKGWRVRCVERAARQIEKRIKAKGPLVTLEMPEGAEDTWEARNMDTLRMIIERHGDVVSKRQPSSERRPAKPLTSSDPSALPTVAKKRGRPRGSKNKPKVHTNATVAAPVTSSIIPPRSLLSSMPLVLVAPTGTPAHLANAPAEVFGSPRASESVWSRHDANSDTPAVPRSLPGFAPLSHAGGADRAPYRMGTFALADAAVTSGRREFAAIGSGFDNIDMLCAVAARGPRLVEAGAGMSGYSSDII